MKHKTLLLVLGGLVMNMAIAQQPTVTPILSKDFKEIPGKEGLMMIVEFPPGGADPIHRHNAHGFI